MAELTAKQRRRGRDLAESVAKMAAAEPEGFAKIELYRAANAIRKHYGYKESEKEAEVLRRIRIGASTVNDLIRETGFTQPDIWRITKALEESKLIYLQKVSVSGNGRPSCLFFATNQAV